MIKIYQEELEPFGTIFYDYLLFKEDYSKHPGLRKVILVEGATDKIFINTIKSAELSCVTVNEIYKSQCLFKPNKKTGITSNKKIIQQLLTTLCMFPDVVACFPKQAKEWPLFGLIDADFDRTSNPQMKQLFITDTHDLETLLISTDKNLLKKQGNISISDDDIRRTLFLSEQLSEIRLSLSNCPTTHLEAKDGIVPFSVFSNLTDGINIDKLLGYLEEMNINFHCSKDCLIKKLNKIKAIDKKGNWKRQWDSYHLKNEGNELWLKINGHDFLSALRFVLPEIDKFFPRYDKEHLNRSIENEIIKQYDSKNFLNTNLFKSMNDFNLLNIPDHLCPNRNSKN